MAYRVTWYEKSLADLKGIDRQTAKKIIDRIKTFLAEYPEWRGKEIKGGFKGMYRYHHIDHLIIYVIDRPEKVIKILQVEHRKEIYKSKGKSQREF